MAYLIFSLAIITAVKHACLSRAFVATIAAFALSIVAPASSADDDEDEIELDEAEVFIEFNSTDGDFGIQFFWDGEAWKRMEVEGPYGETVLKVRARRNLKAQGLTEGFFESAEPSVDELSMEEFLDRFPEGEYEFEGETLEEDELVGETAFTHTLPAAPANLLPAAGSTVSPAGFLASFTHSGTVELYEVIVEKLDDDPILQVFSVILPPGQTSVFVPEEFLEPSTDYKLEVIAQEESGNRTIAETRAFTTGP